MVSWPRFSAVAVAVVVALATAGCSGGSNPAAGAQYPLVARAARIAAPSLALSDSREQRDDGLPRRSGHATVVDLEVPGSTASLLERATLNAAMRQAAAVNARFVSVLEDATSVRPAQFVAQGHVVTYPNVAEVKLARQARLLAATGLPTCLVVDRRGRVAARIVGLVNPDRLLATIRAVVAEG